MRDNGGNAISDKEPRFFSLEEAFLTRKNYKVIFCITFILAAVRTVFWGSLLLGWKLTEWEATILVPFFFVTQLITGFIFVFIPVAFVVRVIFTYLLKRKIDQLDQAIWKRIAAPYVSKKNHMKGRGK